MKVVDKVTPSGEKSGMDEYKDFFNATTIFTEPVKRFYYLFSKSGFTETVRTQAQHDGVEFVSLDQLFMVG